jgi:hypothetical protein
MSCDMLRPPPQWAVLRFSRICGVVSPFNGVDLTKRGMPGQVLSAARCGLRPCQAIPLVFANWRIPVEDCRTEQDLELVSPRDLLRCHSAPHNLTPRPSSPSGAVPHRPRLPQRPRIRIAASMSVTRCERGPRARVMAGRASGLDRIGSLGE